MPARSYGNDNKHYPIILEYGRFENWVESWVARDTESVERYIREKGFSVNDPNNKWVNVTIGPTDQLTRYLRSDHLKDGYEDFGEELATDMACKAAGGSFFFGKFADDIVDGRKLLPHGPGGSAWTRAYQRGEIAVDPNRIRFTQRSAGGGNPPRAPGLRENLSKGWDPD